MVKTESKELLRAALLGQETERVLFAPNLAYLFPTLPEDIQALGHMGFCELVGADQLNRSGPVAVKAVLPEKAEVKISLNEGVEEVLTITPVGTIRQTYERTAISNSRFPVEHPLKTEEDYKVAMWLEENMRFEPDSVAVKKCFAENPDALNIGMLIPRGRKSAFQCMIENLVGTEKLIYDLYDFPETVNALWELMVGNNLKAVEKALESDYEFFITWEDSSTQNYSPEMYEDYIATEIMQWCSILNSGGKHYIQHACGHVKNILPSMNKQGILAVESLSPAPTGNISVKDARRILDSNIGIIGGIEPTELLNKSVNELTPYVEQIIEDAKGGPFILANADSCPPGVSIEKFKHISRLVKELT